MTCHACERDAIVRYRVVPYSETLTLFDAQPKDILACKPHLEAAKRIGQVLSVTPLSGETVARLVQP